MLPLLLACVSLPVHRAAVEPLQAELAAAQERRDSLAGLSEYHEQRAAAAEAAADEAEARAQNAAANVETWRDEAGARLALEQGIAAQQRWDWPAARSAADEVLTRYGGTRARQGAEWLKRDAQVVGADALEISAETWFTPRQEPEDIVVVVFWEVWSPPSRAALPALVELDALDGVELVTLSKLSMNASAEDVQAFLDEHGYRFAAGKEPVANQQSRAYGVTHLPSAVVLHEDTVVWRGHPKNLGADALIALRDGRLP